MWEIRPSTLRNNPGNRPRIYMGYNTTVAEPEQRALYQALGVDPAPGGVKKLVVA